jgi:hypothetical protein
MEARGIPTQSELALLVKRAGYRHIYQTLISQWMSGAFRPKNPLRFCYYLDKALTLTAEEQERVAASLGRQDYPVTRARHPRISRGTHSLDARRFASFG